MNDLKTPLDLAIVYAEIIKKQDDMLKMIVDHDRTRGYPTGPEWMLIVRACKEAIGATANQAGGEK